MPTPFRIGLFLAALLFSPSFAAPAMAADYASEISAYRRAHGLSAVKLDSRLNEVALKQARAMAATGTVSHSADGAFSSRVAPLRKSRAAENIGAGFLSFAEMLKQWEDSTGHRENLLMAGARKVGVASVDNPTSPYRKFWGMVITESQLAALALVRSAEQHLLDILDPFRKPRPVARERMPRAGRVFRARPDIAHRGRRLGCRLRRGKFFGFTLEGRLLQLLLLGRERLRDAAAPLAVEKGGILLVDL